MPQTIDPSKRGQSTQGEILAAFRDRLREAIDGANDLTCFISDQPIPPTIPGGGGFAITVSAGDGNFDQSMFAGGGHATLSEQSQIIVTAMVKINIDRIPQAERAVLASDRGILTVYKRQILKALLVDDPILGVNSPGWEPAIGDRPLCREQIRPTTATAPSDVPGHPGWIGLQITFAVSFDWELYS